MAESNEINNTIYDAVSNALENKNNQCITLLPSSTGKSTYDLAVDYGYVGTEREWLNHALNDTELLNNLRKDATDLAAYIDTIPSVVNDAINNTAVEGGVLADTFVTATAKFGGVARTQADKNSDSIHINDFGNVLSSNPIKNTSIFNTALASSVENNFTLILDGSKQYTINKLVIPSGTKLQTNGATFLSVGDLTLKQFDVFVRDNVTIDSLKVVKSANSGSNAYIVSIGDNVQVRALEVSCNEQWSEAGVLGSGHGFNADSVIIKNIDKAIDFLGMSRRINSNETIPAKKMHIKYLEVVSYRRGIYLSHVYDWTVGSFYMHTRSPNAPVLRAGENGFLISGCSNWTVGDGVGNDASEAFFRIGGATGGGVTDNWYVGNLVIDRARGNAFKSNANINKEYATNGYIKSITAYDIGEGPDSNNQELLRLSHVKTIRVGSISAKARIFNQGAQHALVLNDATDIHIESITGDFKGGIKFDEGTDLIDAASEGGTVSDVYIDYANFTVVAKNAIDINFSLYPVSNINFNNIIIRGFTDNLFYVSKATVFPNPVRFSGIVLGNVRPTIAGVATDKVIYNILYGNHHFSGIAGKVEWDIKATFSMMTNNFDSGDTRGSHFVMSASSGTPGLGEYGSALEFTRVGAGRRGAAIALKQTGQYSIDTGIAILTSGGEAASDALTDSVVVNHLGHIIIKNMASSDKYISRHTLYAGSDGIVRIKQT